VTGSQIAALVFAILFLLPGGCFLIVGIGLADEFAVIALIMVPIGLAILALAGYLFYLAFRRAAPQSPESPPAPPV